VQAQRSGDLGRRCRDRRRARHADHLVRSELKILRREPGLEAVACEQREETGRSVNRPTIVVRIAGPRWSHAVLWLSRGPGRADELLRRDVASPTRPRNARSRAVSWRRLCRWRAGLESREYRLPGEAKITSMRRAGSAQRRSWPSKPRSSSSAACAPSHPDPKIQISAGAGARGSGL
jgi:hypothetical protein